VAELIELKVDGGILLKGVNHLEDQELSFVVEIASEGFGLEKLHTVSTNIPAGSEVDIITLVPTPNQNYSYTVNYRYTTKKTETIIVTEKSATPTSQVTQVVTEVVPVKPETMEIPDGIVVYSQEGCGRCEYITNYLRLNEIPFTDLNTSKDQSADDQMSKVY